MGLLMRAPQKRPWTAEEFSKFLESRPEHERWQLLDGIAVMMTPPSKRHQIIARNLVILLNTALANHRPGWIAVQEPGVMIPGIDAFRPEADVAVVEAFDDEGRYFDRFFLVVEILSESNREEYIETKRQRYIAHPENQYCLILDQMEMRVEIWAKSAGWRGSLLRAHDDRLELPELGLSCTLDDIYAGTSLVVRSAAPKPPRKQRAKSKKRSRRPIGSKRRGA